MPGPLVPSSFLSDMKIQSPPHEDKFISAGSLVYLVNKINIHTYTYIYIQIDINHYKPGTPGMYNLKSPIARSLVVSMFKIEPCILVHQCRSLPWRGRLRYSTTKNHGHGYFQFMVDVYHHGMIMFITILMGKVIISNHGMMAHHHFSREKSQTFDWAIFNFNI